MSAAPSVAVTTTDSSIPRNRVLCGDALDVLRSLPDACVDAVVTDPPAGISFMGRQWDSDHGGRREWCAAMAAIFREALRVLRPGGHALVWALPRTSHWTATALEDAGWEIREKIYHLFGSGFPKSLDPLKAAQKSGLVCCCRKDVLHSHIERSERGVTHGDVPSLREAATEDAAEPTAHLLLNDLHGDGSALIAGGQDLRGVRQGVATRDAVSGSTQQDMLGIVQRQENQPSKGGQAHQAGGNLPALWPGVLDTEQGAGECEILQPFLPVQSVRTHSHSTRGQHEGAEAARSEARPGQSVVEGRSDVEADARQLSGRDVRSMSAGIPANGASRRLHHGAPASDGAEVGAAPDAAGGGPSPRPQSGKQPSRQSGTLPQQRSAQTCGRCGLPVIPEGLGTALKPAVEEWVLCRKPLAERTVAANVLAHGTGAINIDACRVAVDPGGVDDPRLGGNGAWHIERNPDGHTVSLPPATMASHRGGRWPANLMLSHSPLCRPAGTRRVKGSRIDKPCDYHGDPGAFGHGRARPARGIGDADGMETIEAWECVDGCPVRELDAQAGVRSSGKGNRIRASAKTANYRPNTYGAESRPEGQDQISYGDSGGASRFFPVFYCPKASQAERNAGLGEVSPRRKQNELPPGDAFGNNFRKGNGHPTVKPLALMAWLCRLITPPHGLILDPFAGSGSTGVAAITEGFDYLLIEREPEYVAIAEARLAHARKEMQKPVPGTPRKGTTASKPRAARQPKSVAPISQPALWREEEASQ